MHKLKSVERLEDSLTKLPSVGRRSAERMAFAMLDMSKDDLAEFAKAITEVKEKIHYCPICGNITDEEICNVCSDSSRDHSTVIVVSNPRDIIAFEKAEEYKGLYHVLGGTISISKGMGVEDLRIPELLDRVSEGKIKEVIIATNPTIDGETTALYLAKLLEDKNVNVTRIAYGLPMGGNLDYTDSLTLNRALEGRRKI